MTNHLLRKATVGWGTLLIAAAAMLAVASPALAVQTNQYDAFSACPTKAPVLNEPASEIAVCAAGVAHGGALKIGALTIPLSQLGVQFGATGLGLEEPECPEPGLCFGRAPGTTTLKSPPSVINIQQPVHGKGPKGKGVSVKVTVESAGDVRAVSPGFLFEAPVPLYKLPIKLHVEAPWLGRECYVGSDDEPIFLTPFVVGPPASVNFGGDPNGFSTEIISLTGMPLMDKAIAIPAAEECGHSYGWRRHGRRHGHHWHCLEDRLVNDLLGLPSPSGANEVVLPNTDVAFAVAGFDGTPPDGGAELQAAFDAAK